MTRRPNKAILYKGFDMTYPDWIALGGYSIIALILLFSLLTIRMGIREFMRINDPDAGWRLSGRWGKREDDSTPERTGKVREAG